MFTIVSRPCMGGGVAPQLAAAGRKSSSASAVNADANSSGVLAVLAQREAVEGVDDLGAVHQLLDDGLGHTASVSGAFDVINDDLGYDREARVNDAGTTEIEAFVTLAEELHFGRTAERLHVSTARVSQAIKRMELRVGVPLFERTSRRVELTAAGRALLGRGRARVATDHRRRRGSEGGRGPARRRVRRRGGRAAPGRRGGAHSEAEVRSARRSSATSCRGCATGPSTSC